MKAELIDVMGDDLRVVNAARVSFDKESEWEPVDVEHDPFGGFSIEYGQKLGEKDVKLLNYLAKHGHWTPFSHVMITMRETVPIFIARQRFKHKVGFTENEVSRRYVDDKPEFFTPDEWRGRAGNKKQGSSDVVISIDDDLYEGLLSHAEEVYNKLLEAGVAPEQARMVLPQSMMTSYYVTGSLSAWARAYKLRSYEDAQKEIRDLASQWGEIIGSIPSLQHSWAALTQ